MAAPAAQFDTRIWCAASVAAGFVTALLFAALFWLVDPVTVDLPLDGLPLRALGLLAIAAILSLPALAQQLVLQRAGIRAPWFYATTVAGGWAMFAAAVEALQLIDGPAASFKPYGIDLEFPVLIGFPLLAAAGTGFLQTATLPQPMRRLARWIVPPAAAFALAATVVMLASVMLAIDVGHLARVTLDVLAFGVGWGLFAAATAWPIRRAVRQLNRRATSV